MTAFSELPAALVIQARAIADAVVADPVHSEAAARALVDEARAASDAEALVIGLQALAWSRRSAHDLDVAARLVGAALRVARRQRIDHRLAQLFVVRAVVAQEAGRPAAARRDLRAAGTHEGGDWSDAIALQQATLHHNAGRLAEAASLYQRIWDRPDATVVSRAKASNNLADLEATRGRADAAARWIAEAERLAPEVGAAMVAFVAHSRADISARTGRAQQSLAEYETAGRLYAAAGLPPGDQLVDYAVALSDLRLLPEALAMAQRAAAELEAEGARLLVPEARLRVAHLALLSGQPDLAVREAEAAQALFRAHRRTAWTARCAVVCARARLASGSASGQDARAARQAGSLLARQGMRSDAVEAYLAAGQVGLALADTGAARRSLERARRLADGGTVLVRIRGDVAAASAATDDRHILQHCRQGLRRLAVHREALPSTELRALASGHGAELGVLGLRVLLRSGSATAVLAWTERTRAASLAVTVAAPALADAVDEEALAELRRLQAELAGRRAAGEQEPPALVSRLRRLEARLRTASWTRGPASSGRAGGAVRMPPVVELRACLGDHTLASYAAVDGELVAVTADTRRTRLVRLGPLEPIVTEVNAIRFALRRLAMPRRTPAAGRQLIELLALRRSRLAAMLIEPLGVDPADPLVLVPSARLQGVPWAALHAGPVSLAPSAWLWQHARASGSPPAGVVLVAGPELPGAEDEVRELARLHPGALALLPPDSTPTATLRALAGVGLAHLACHGRLRADNPTFSELVLSAGSLTVHELDARGIAPHRVIMAACEAAADQAYDGEELIGFVSALLARGTCGLVASTVAVPDVASIGLMSSLHSALLRGATLAQALHAARAELDTADPAQALAWHAFGAYGPA